MNDELRRFESGAVRSMDAEATRYDLLSPIAVEAIAATYAEGATKHGDFNWEKGMPVHDLLNHALRHVFLFLSGDRSEPHLPHAAWGLMAAIHSDAMWPDLNLPHLRQPGCVAPCVRVPETEEQLIDAIAEATANPPRRGRR